MCFRDSIWGVEGKETSSVRAVGMDGGAARSRKRGADAANQGSIKLNFNTTIHIKYSHRYIFYPASRPTTHKYTTSKRRGHYRYGMITLVGFDLDGTLAESKQALKDTMSEALADLLSVAHVAIISGGDWPQFHKQIVSRLPARADLSKLWLMPTTGTKLYTHRNGEWKPVYAELFSEDDRKRIIKAFEDSLEATGFKPEKTWGERIEDRGSQITFSALGQQAPIAEKERWDPDFAKRKVIQADLRKRLPKLSINMGGATSIDITQKGVDKGYGLKKLHDASGIPLEQMMFIGDAIFPGGNDYPAKELGLKTVRVKDPDGTLAAIAGIVACLS
jgi:phosphomannomutase